MAMRRMTFTVMFLHVGPSGDSWIGTSIYAAKHLQPDYAKSIQIPQGIFNDAILMVLDGGRHSVL
jgi:hypothetical protein